MAKLYVTGFAGTGDITGQGNIAMEPEVSTEAVSFTGTAGTSAAFAANVQIVRLEPDGICSVVFGTAPTATTANRRMSAGQAEYFKVPAGKAYKVSAITNT